MRYNSWVKIVCLYITVFYGSALSIQDSNDVQILWQQKIEPREKVSSVLGSMALQSNGNLLIAGLSFDEEKKIDGKLMLWEIDRSGKITKEEQLRGVPDSFGANMKQAHWLITGINSSPSGKLHMIGKFDDMRHTRMIIERGENKPSKVHVSRISEIARNKKETLQDSSEINLLGIAVFKEVMFDDGSSLLLGREGNSGALIIKVDSEGDALWCKSIDRGELCFLTDGIPFGQNGDSLLVGCSAKQDGENMFPSSPSAVWVFRCNTQGEIVSEKSFSGSAFPSKLPKICRFKDDDHIAILYDRSEDMNTTEITMKVLTNDLKSIVWEKLITKSDDPLMSFRIAQNGKKGAVVAYTENTANLANLKISVFDGEGNRTKHLSFDKPVRMNDFNVVVGDKVYVAYQSVATREKSSQITLLAISND